MANVFKRKISKDVGIAFTKINNYQIPAATIGTIIGLSVANVTTGDITVSVALNTGTSRIFIVKDATVLRGGTLIAVGGEHKIVLEPSDFIEVSCSEDAAADVIVSILEISE